MDALILFNVSVSFGSIARSCSLNFAGLRGLLVDPGSELLDLRKLGIVPNKQCELLVDFEVATLTDQNAKIQSTSSLAVL